MEVRDPQRGNGPKAEAKHGGKAGVLYIFMPPLERLVDELVARPETDPTSFTPAAFALSLGTAGVIIGLKRLRPHWPGMMSVSTTDRGER